MENLVTSMEFLEIQKFIEEKCGIALGDQKTYLLESKLIKLMEESTYSGIKELYLKICIAKDPVIIRNVIDSITTNETFWFRDKSPWYMMENIFLPVYIEELRNKARHKVRIWSAACSYGQEPYSIAMSIDNYLKRNGIQDVKSSDFEIIATDISYSALSIAESGKYDNISISRGLDEHYKFTYFEKDGRGWKLNDEIKRMIRFQQFNLIKDPYSFGQFDIIFCRNVLIYFSETYKKEVFKKISRSLKNNGILFVGSSELLDDYNKDFSREQYENGIYFKKRSEEYVL